MKKPKEVQDLLDLLEITRAISAEMDLRRLMQLIVDAATRISKADRTSLYLVDHKQKEIWTWVADQLEIKEIRIPIGKGIAGTVAESGEVINIIDAYEDERFDRTWDKKTNYRTRSILCVPIIHQGKTIGVLQTFNKQGGQPFTDYDRSLLEGLASSAAVALNNAELVQHYLEKQKMEQALSIACEIQQNLLPKEVPYLEIFDIAAESISCDETGGDYYDFIPIDERRIAVVIGDVTGHGIGPALLMTTARAFLRGVVQTGTSEPADVLKAINKLLTPDMGGGRFMTLCYGILDDAESLFRYASAGHEPAILYDASMGEFRDLPSTGIPIAIADDFAYSEGEQTRMREGDLLILVTDGITETANESGELFGKKRLCECIKRNASKRASDILAEIQREVLRFRGEARQRDDVTLTVVKRL